MTSTCPHEQRPGTTVCLRCRHEARVASIARARRMALLGVAGAITVGALAVLGVRAATAFTRRQSAPEAPVQPQRVEKTDSANSDSTRSAPSPVATPPIASTKSADSPALSAPRQSARVAPVIGEGTTALPDGMTAVRTGDTVAVTFDSPTSRTRRPEKFEQIVRATIGDLYGAAADSAMRVMPEGSVARAGDLISELPTRGVRVALASGDTLAIWPTTRRGRDGPLVVAYRATVTR